MYSNRVLISVNIKKYIVQSKEVTKTLIREEPRTPHFSAFMNLASLHTAHVTGVRIGASFIKSLQRRPTRLNARIH
jgi:hypothetical protein